MSLAINHNIAALNAHRNLLMTTESLQRSMQRLSSGFRINRASDDPAGLVISEQFRAQIAGLNRAIQNSEGSINMIQTAEGALTEINSLLISMRELAIHAANEGFNSADQLAADQAEIANAIKTIDRIAANTQFGTKKLIDGSNANTATITSSNSSGITIKESFLSDGLHSITATKSADATASLNTTSLGLSLLNTSGDPVNLTEAIHNVDVVQASDVARKRSGTVTLADAFGNNLTLAAAATVGMISSGAVATATASHAGNYTVTINYQENGESPSGNQTFVVAVVSGDTTSTIAAKLQTQINLNTAMAGKVVVTGTDAGALRIKSANLGAQFSVQTQASSTTAAVSLFSFTAGSSRGVSANVLNYTVTSATQSNTTSDITVVAATYTSMTALATAIDTAMDTAFGKVAGDAAVSDFDVAVYNANRLEFHSNDEGSAYSIKLNVGLAGTGNLRNALNLTNDSIASTGVDALVSFDNFTNTITKVNYGTTGTVTLKNKADGDASQGTVSMIVSTALNGINLGNLLLDVKAAKFDVRLNGGPATSVTAGKEFTIFNNDRSESLKVVYGLNSEGGTETINNFDRSLVFQIGANVGQTVSIGMRNMSASTLGTGLVGNLFRSLSSIDVTTVQGSQDAQSVIDLAINEVTSARGTLGSFQKNTLESNLRNLRVAAQNLTAAESQIRDTDMAKEMSEFTKHQILLQAGTAMLAQANQVPQVILSLFG